MKTSEETLDISVRIFVYASVMAYVEASDETLLGTS